VDCAIISNNYYSNFIKQCMVFDLPYMFDSCDDYFAVVDDPEVSKVVKEVLYDYGVKQFGYGYSGYRHMFTNTPVYNVSDIKGMKVRLPEAVVFVEAFKAFGANPVTMPFSETYTAVQQGAVDGLELTASAAATARYQDITKYLDMTAHYQIGIAINMSRQLWESLTEEEQGWFTVAAEKACAEQRESYKAIEQQLIDEMGETMTIIPAEDIDIDSFKATVKEQ
jgi:TRAP-type C4-dicarboxylate transport system substrate-binding protein